MKAAVAGLLLAAATAHADEVAALVVPVRESTLSMTVVGRVAAVPVADGAAVAEGDLLVELERRVEELDAERRRLVHANTAELDAARARVAQLAAELEGTRRLFASTGSVSREELERKDLELQTARAELDQLALREEIEALDHALALEQVRRRELRAPHAGRAVEVLAEVGETVEPRQPLVRLVDASRVHVVANVEAAAAFRLDPARPLRVRVPTADGDVEREGRVEYLAPVVDAASGLRKVRVEVDNADGRIVPGVQAVLILP